MEALEGELEREGKLRRESETAKGLVEDDLEENKAQLATAERAQDELERSLLELDQNLTEVRERERGATKRNEALSTDLAKREERVTALLKETHLTERERLTVEEDLREERTRGESLREELENARNGLGEWRNKHRQAASQRDEHAARVAKLEGDLSKSEASVARAEEVGARLAQTLAKRDVEVEDLAGEGSGLKHEAAELRAEIGGLSERGRKAESDISALKQNLSESERQLAATSEGKQKTDARLRALEGRHAGLEAEAASTAAALSHLEDRHANLARRETELTARVAEAENELAVKASALIRAEAGLEELRTKDLPEALEQKVRAYRETMDRDFHPARAIRFVSPPPSLRYVWAKWCRNMWGCMFSTPAWRDLLRTI